MTGQLEFDSQQE